MKINEAGIELIKSFEGLRLKSYKDSVGIWTIGWGTTRVNGHPIQEGQTCTEEDADNYMRTDLIFFENLVNKFVTVPLNDNQFAATCSACYNIGPGSKGHKDGIFTLSSGSASTFLRKLNDGDYDGAADELPKWNKAGGVPLAGLTRRRLAEKALFSAPA